MLSDEPLDETKKIPVSLEKKRRKSAKNQFLEKKAKILSDDEADLTGILKTKKTNKHKKFSKKAVFSSGKRKVVKERKKPPQLNILSEEDSDFCKREEIVEHSGHMTWLQAAEIVLGDFGPEGLHFKDLHTAIVHQGLVSRSSGTSLEALLYRETAQGSVRFERVPGARGFFRCVANSEKKSSFKESTSAMRKWSFDKLLTRYKNMKREFKDLLFKAKKQAMYFTTFTKQLVERVFLRPTIAVLLLNSFLRHEVELKKNKFRRLHQFKSYMLSKLVEFEPLSLDEPFYDESSENSDFSEFSDLELKPIQKPLKIQSKASRESGSAGEASITPRKKTKKTRTLSQVRYPMKLNGLVIHSIGTLEVKKPGYRSSKYLWPVGFKATRLFASQYNPDEKVEYHCAILDSDDGPVFQVIPEDDKDNPIVEKTPTDAHRRILININRAKRRDVKHLGAGPGFFGISNQTVVDMLNQMPESHLAWQTEPSKYEAISGRVDHKPSRRQSSCFSEDEELDENSAIEDGRSSENELWREKK